MAVGCGMGVATMDVSGMCDGPWVWLGCVMDP